MLTYICYMAKSKAYIAYVLMAALVAVLTPWPLLHDAIAHHTLADDTRCAEFHKNIGTHVEQSHGHCPLFDAKAPLYTRGKGIANLSFIQQLQAVYHTPCIVSVAQSTRFTLPQRGPPVV